MLRETSRVPSSRPPTPAWRRAASRRALAIGLLSCVAATAADAQSATRAGAPKLLLLPFVVHSAEDPSYVRGGLADMLRARFARIGGLQLLVEEDAEKGTARLETALDAARAAGADYVLFGSFTRFGKGASLDAQCAPVRGGPGREPLREIFVHSGSIGEIIPDLDELAGKVTRFTRGEIVSSGPAAPAPAGGSAAEIRALRDRVTALEEAIAQLLERAEEP